MTLSRFFDATCWTVTPEGETPTFQGKTRTNADFANEQEAIDFVEAGKFEGQYIEFQRVPNNHGGFKSMSLSLNVWENGEWRKPNIHGGC